MKEFTEISSKENPVIKLCRALNDSSKKRRKEGLFVLEGLRICEDAYQNGVEIKALFVTESAFLKHKNIISRFSEKSEKCYMLSEDLFEKISDTLTPQGIIMIGVMPKNSVFSDKTGKFIALENLQDPSNLGAVSRTAEALGVSGIIISSNGCDPYSPKALRASMGTLLRMPLFITDEIIGFCKEKGLRTIACVVDSNAESISDFSFSSGDVLLIGNEGNGLSDETKKNADHRITIRMSGKAESLNAAAAAAIAVWEMCK